MAVDDRISFFGVGIQTLEPRFEVISIQTLEPRFEGISIVTNNYAFGTFLVTDTDNNPIEGALVSITSTQTNPSNFIGVQKAIALRTDRGGRVSPTPVGLSLS